MRLKNSSKNELRTYPEVRMTQPLRIVFFGTSRFASEVLSHLANQKPHIDIAAIVTRPDKPQGRSLRVSSSPVKEKALQILPLIPLYQPVKASTEEFAATLRPLSPDLFVVVAYGEIIKQNLLSIPRLGCINIHASLLPKYRGAAPIQRCLMAGEKETGITIIEMVLALDAGPMIEKAPVPISDEMTFGELEQKMMEAACLALDNALKAFVENRVKKELQDESQATYAAKLTPGEEKISWEHSAEHIHNLIRALSPTPGAWCMVSLGEQEKRLKIKRSRLRRDLNGEPGQILVQKKDSLVVACGQGALEILEVQLEGKKTLELPEFLRGISNTSIKFSQTVA